MTRILLFLFFFGMVCPCVGQQMAVFKKGRVIARFNLGDPIRYVSKDGQTHNAAILSIREFEFVTLQKDTVKFSDVAKLKFKNRPWTYVKSTLIGSATLAALAFALEPAVGDDNPGAIKGMKFAAAMGVVSAAFVFSVSKSSIKLNGFKRLKFINYDSPLYR